VTTTLRHLLVTAYDAVTTPADVASVDAALHAYHRGDLDLVAEHLSLVDSLPTDLADALEVALAGAYHLAAVDARTAADDAAAEAAPEAPEPDAWLRAEAAADAAADAAQQLAEYLESLGHHPTAAAWAAVAAAHRAAAVADTHRTARAATQAAVEALRAA
jgi:hypothetical protein